MGQLFSLHRNFHISIIWRFAEWPRPLTISLHASKFTPSIWPRYRDIRATIILLRTSKMRAYLAATIMYQRLPFLMKYHFSHAHRERLRMPILCTPSPSLNISSFPVTRASAYLHYFTRARAEARQILLMPKILIYSPIRHLRLFIST